MSQANQKPTSKNNRSLQDKPREGNPLLTGILIGLVLGVGLCSSVAIWIARSPSPFTNRALQTMGIMKGPGLQATGSGVAETDSASPSAGPLPSGDSGSPPLANQSPAAANSGSSPSAVGVVGSSSTNPETSAPSSTNSSDPNKPLPSSSLYVQVGAFSTQEEAQKQVEIVAQLTGLRARIWPSLAADSSKVFYRVRLGAYAQTSDTNELTQILKSNGLSFVLVRPTAGETPQ
jgi:cell division septation protein DedD